MPLQYKGTKPDKYIVEKNGLYRATLELAYAPNGWEAGEENRNASDCSGIPSYAWTRCGYPIRMRAADFFAKIYVYPTLRAEGSDFVIDYPALFVITLDTVDNGILGVRYAGEAVHVAPFIGGGVVLDANYEQDMITPFTEEWFRWEYESPSTFIVKRYPSLNAIKNHAWHAVDGLDPSIMDYGRRCCPADIDLNKYPLPTDYQVFHGKDMDASTVLNTWEIKDWLQQK